MKLPQKITLSVLALAVIIFALVAVMRLVTGKAATTIGASTPGLSSPQGLLDQINSAEKVISAVQLEGENGQSVSKQVLSPDESLSKQLEPTLKIDEILVCDAWGSCTIVQIPLNAEEQAVVNGTSTTGVSVRAVYNADQPGGPVQFLDKIYGRAIVSPTASGERWYKQIDFGRSWDSLVETSITRGKNRCNSQVVTPSIPARIVATMDNTTCDGDGKPAVIRWAALVAENDLQNCTTPGPTSLCKIDAPITVLPARRKGYMIIYDDELKKIYQARVPLGQPLP